MDEQYFLEAIAQNPTDVTHRLIFADWLEEQGDPRCEAVRHQCRFRMPFTRDELQRFEKIVQARDLADGTLVHVDIELPASELGIYHTDDIEQAPQVVDEVVECLDSNRLARYFPWDDGGRLPLKSVVQLRRIREDLRDYHQLAIVACGPARRSDPQQISLRLMPLRNRMVTDDWRRERWRWDRRVPVEDELVASGYDRSLVEMTRFDHGPQLLGPLWQNAGQGLEDRERMALATLLLDAGRFEDALQVSGVGIVPELSQRLDGISPWTQESAQQVDRIGAALRRELWESAPWTFARRVEEAEWETGWPTSGLSALPVRQLLFPLPGQTTIGKWWLALCRAESGQPILDFVETPAPSRAPRHLWKRPLEFDIARLKVEAES